MNIAKCKQMSLELPDVNVMTFSDFTHGLFAANYPQCKQSDITSIVNTLRLMPQTTMLNDFIDKLAITNQQDKMTALTLFTNANLDFVIQTLSTIQKADYALESMVVQNTLYTDQNNPYDFDAILINGVQNMPVPILCTILEYMNRYHCNLFMTGSPQETVYDFNMAYENAMNVLSAYPGIQLIRITDTYKISDDIRHFMHMDQTAKIDSIKAVHMNTTYDTPLKELLTSAIGLNTDYLKSKIESKQPVLILARSKSDIAEIKQVLNEQYITAYPNLKILDLSVIQAVQTTYGEVASKYYHNFMSKYPNGVTVIQFFYDLYNFMTYEQNSNGTPNAKTQIAIDKEKLPAFLESHRNIFTDNNAVFAVKDIIQAVIDIESETIRLHNKHIRDNAVIDTSDADIILSTIHTAIDIRSDNVMIIMRNFNEKIDENLYRVAISRANKSECIIFMNYGPFEISYQRYLKLHSVVK